MKVSPIVPTSVFAFVAVAASTSANLCDSSAPIPNAVIASVTMSETVPNSSPEAAARFITPASPFIMSEVPQPAIAIYSRASPASTAVNFVVAPISLARAVKSSISPADAPEIALTVDICS